MKEEIVFRSVEELYNRVLPALYSKRKEINSLGFKLVTEKDIWNYLVENEWKTKRNLELHDLINDIFYVDNIKINDYCVPQIEKNHNIIYPTIYFSSINPEELDDYFMKDKYVFYQVDKRFLTSF